MLVALVGATGAGKSTALQIAHGLGYNTVNMDKVVHDLYAFGKPGYAAVARHFGEQYVNGQAVDRKLLAQLIFAQPQKLEELKALVYPLVVTELSRLNGDWLVEMPAYTNDPGYWSKHFAATILIKAPEAARRARLLEKNRGVDKLSTDRVENYLRLVAAGLSDASFVVENAGDRASFAQRLGGVLAAVFSK